MTYFKRFKRTRTSDFCRDCNFCRGENNFYAVGSNHYGETVIFLINSGIFLLASSNTHSGAFSFCEKQLPFVGTAITGKRDSNI